MGERLLRGADLRIVDLREVEGVAAGRDDRIQAEARQAGIVLAGNLAGDLELSPAPSRP